MQKLLGYPSLLLKFFNVLFSPIKVYMFTVVVFPLRLFTKDFLHEFYVLTRLLCLTRGQVITLDYLIDHDLYSG